MTTTLPTAEKVAQIVYPSRDDEPVAETYTHLYAIFSILEVLKQYLAGEQATVLANQFLYYAQGFPRLRVAPDVMVIFNVTPGGRDNYKIWEEGEVPKVIFEVTSEGTRNQDLEFKKTLYEQLGVEEYWLFDPKGEWIKEQLIGYTLGGEFYNLISDSLSRVLNLRLEVQGNLLGFYRLDNGEKLLISEELAIALDNALATVQQEKQRADRLAEQLRALGVEPEI